MKLIFCWKCHDVVVLKKELRSCGCGKCSGQYNEDGLNATISGPCTPIGFANASFTYALRNRDQTTKDKGLEFTAFVISEDADTIHRTD